MLRRMVLCLIFSSCMAAQTKSPVPVAGGEFQISGTVVDFLTGQPLAKTRVAIAPVSQRGDLTTVVTSDDGRFIFRGLARNKYTLTAQRRGYITASFNQHDQYASSIAVGPDLDSGHLLFRLTAESVISGTVTDEQGDGVRNAQVMLFQDTAVDGRRSTRQRANASTDEEGFYRFAHLPAGRYFLAVSAEPWYAQHYAPRNTTSFYVVGNGSTSTSYRSPGGVAGSTRAPAPAEEPQSPLDVSFPLTFYPGATDAGGATAIVLGKGEKASIDVALTPVRAMHFRVNAENSPQQPGPSEPQHGFSIHLEQTLFDGTPVFVSTQSVSIEPGVMEIVGVVPGRYNMKINSWSGGKQQVLQDREVDVSESGDVNFASSAASVPLTAQVIFDPPATREQLSVLLRDKKSPKVLRENVNDKGEAEFNQGVMPGIYEVSVQNAGQVFIKNLSASGAKVTGRTLEIKGGGPVRLTMTAVQGEGEISGVALREGKPVAGAMVVLVPADPANNRVLFRRDQSDSDGTFRLSDVVPGRYALLAIEDGWELEWANPDVLKKFMPQAEPVVVEPRGKYSVKVKVQ
jgi:carboxypeptidase family protein